MSGYDPLAALAAQPSAPQQAPAAYDPLAALANGKPLPAANEPSAAPSQSWEQNWLQHGNPVDQFVQGAFDQGITSTAGAIKGGLHGLWDIFTGRKAAAPGDVEQAEQAATYKPQTGAQRAGAEAASSGWNPVNWPGVAISKTGEFLGDTAEKLGAPPWLSTALDVAPAAAASYAGLKAGGIEPGGGYVPEVERVAPEAAPEASGAVQPKPATDGPPVEGGLPKSAQAEREAILQRVGIGQARKSAIEGDAKAAATDYQTTRFDEPAGQALAAQFDHERAALTGFTEGLIKKAGGTIGTDEDALISRGTTIAKPFDDLREWFKARTKQLYAQAQSRSDELAANGNPAAYTQLQGVDKLLRSPTFRNTLMARDQGGLLSSIQAQLDHFRETNPNGFTPAGAEQFRQWLNQVWSPDKSWAIGQVTNAVDSDVLDQAGENIYGPARAMRTLKAATLDNPDGIAQLFDHDPKTPINRATPLEKIPDKIMALPAEQFSNLVDTLKKMPPELQPQADAALGEIKGQLLNRILKAGTETRTGRGAQLWRGEDVSQVLARHAAKFRIAFGDDPELQDGIKDLNSAGQILRTDQSYPGAFAQAANMTKRGIGSSIVRQVGRAGGAMAGGVLGPLGAAGGEMAGSAAGEAAASALAERAALKAVKQRIVSLEKH